MSELLFWLFLWTLLAAVGLLVYQLTEGRDPRVRTAIMSWPMVLPIAGVWTTWRIVRWVWRQVGITIALTRQGRLFHKAPRYVRNSSRPRDWLDPNRW